MDIKNNSQAQNFWDNMLILKRSWDTKLWQREESIPSQCFDNVEFELDFIANLVTWSQFRHQPNHIIH
jgi:hypothetical protein